MPSRTKGAKTADIIIDSVEWEIKRLMGKSQKSVDKVLYRAAKQSKYIIIDTRESKIQADILYKLIEKYFKARRNIKRVIIIKKHKEIIDLTK